MTSKPVGMLMQLARALLAPGAATCLSNATIGIFAPRFSNWKPIEAISKIGFAGRALSGRRPFSDITYSFRAPRHIPNSQRFTTSTTPFFSGSLSISEYPIWRAVTGWTACALRIVLRYSENKRLMVWKGSTNYVQYGYLYKLFRKHLNDSF